MILELISIQYNVLCIISPHVPLEMNVPWGRSYHLRRSWATANRLGVSNSSKLKIRTESQISWFLVGAFVVNLVEMFWWFYVIFWEWDLIKLRIRMMGISKNGGCPKVPCQWNHDDKQWGLEVYPIFRETHMNVCETSAPWGVCGETEANVGGDWIAALRMLEIPGNLRDFPKCFFLPLGRCWDLDVCRSPKICCGGSWNRCQRSPPLLTGLFEGAADVAGRDSGGLGFFSAGFGERIFRGARTSQFSTLRSDCFKCFLVDIALDALSPQHSEILRTSSRDAAMI